MASKVHTSYHLVVETLSPVHIGSGRDDLLRDYDFVLERNQALVINLDRLLADLDETRLRVAAHDPRLRRLIRPGEEAPYVAYSLSLPQGVPEKIQEQIKDPFLKPYIPGSSIKGALRTALAWSAYKPPLQLGQETKTADDPLERQLFGYDLHQTHRDLFRALRVTDAYPVGNIGLQALPVTVFSLQGQPPSLKPRRDWGGRATTLFVEAIAEGTRLEGSLTLDEYALQHHPQQPEATLYLREQLVQHCRAFAANLVKNELDFYTKHGAPALRGFYQGLQGLMQRQASLGPSEFLLWLGWGPGWRAKTVGTRLTLGEVQRVADKYMRPWRRGLSIGVFPKSRRLVGLEQPQKPLGWVKVVMRAEEVR